jgi:ATP-dependent Clp protease ATP-binding subunit ClpB
MDLINYSDDLKQAIQIAQSIAKENSNEFFSSAHLLKALMHKDIGVRDFLKNLNKDIYFIEEWAEVRIETYAKSSKIPDNIKADGSAISVLNEADNIRLKVADDKIDPICVFVAL